MYICKYIPFVFPYVLRFVIPLHSQLQLLCISQYSLLYIPLITPIPENVYRITDKYGLRMHPIYKRLKRHHGLDLGCETGTPIYATADGYVAFAGRNGGYGKSVKIKHSSKNRKIDFLSDLLKSMTRIGVVHINLITTVTFHQSTLYSIQIPYSNIIFI